MLVIPAVDIMGGEAVRLTKGEFDSKQIFHEDPAQAAMHWQEQGAQRIHVVDLDGAREGRMRNFESVKKIVENTAVEIQVGGGIRTLEDAERVLKLKVKVVLGTSAVKNPALVRELSRRYGSENVIAGLDTKGGEVVVEGWAKGTGQDVFTLACEMEKLGAGAIIFTCVERDGTLSGPDVEMVKRMVNSVEIPVIASGGVSSLDDLRRLKETGAFAVIVGKALYLEKFSFQEAVEAAR